MLKKVLLVSLISALPVMAMHEVELNLNNKDLDLHLGLDMGQYNTSIEPENLMMNMRVLMGSQNNARLPFEREKNVLGEFGFLAQSTSAMAPGLTMGMGVKLAYTYLESESVFTMPIGIEIDYVLPFNIPIPLHIGGLFYYAPEVLSFSSSTSYMEYQGNFDIEVMDRALITMGYRGIDTPVEHQSNAYFNRSYFFGFKYKF